MGGIVPTAAARDNRRGRIAVRSIWRSRNCASGRGR